MSARAKTTPQKRVRFGQAATAATANTNATDPIETIHSPQPQGSAPFPPGAGRGAQRAQQARRRKGKSVGGGRRYGLACGEPDKLRQRDGEGRTNGNERHAGGRRARREPVG